MPEPGVLRQQLHTDDPDVAREYVDAMYAEHEVRLRGHSADFGFRTEVVLVDDVSIGHVQYSMGVDMGAGAGTNALTVIRQMPGTRLRLDHGRDSVTLGDDDLYVLPPGESYSAHFVAMDLTAVGLDEQLLDEDAALLTGYDGGRVSFGIGAAPSAAARGHWLHVQRFVTQNLISNVALAHSAVARRELVRLLNSATLACFPNTTLGDEHDSAGPAVPDAVRRAVDHIEQHADTPLGLDELCTAARLSPRALQAAFRRHLDITPLGYLRQVRLERAHHDLQKAQPGDGQSVATIAARWGFTQLGRFASEHRARYGTTPSHTPRSH